MTTVDRLVEVLSARLPAADHHRIPELLAAVAVHQPSTVRSLEKMYRPFAMVSDRINCVIGKRIGSLTLYIHRCYTCLYISLTLVELRIRILLSCKFIMLLCPRTQRWPAGGGGGREWRWSRGGRLDRIAGTQGVPCQ